MAAIQPNQSDLRDLHHVVRPPDTQEPQTEATEPELLKWRNLPDQDKKEMKTSPRFNLRINLRFNLRRDLQINLQLDLHHRANIATTSADDFATSKTTSQQLENSLVSSKKYKGKNVNLTISSVNKIAKEIESSEAASKMDILNRILNPAKSRSSR